MNINYDKSTRMVSISGSYDVNKTPVFNKSGDTYALTFINLKNVKAFNKFTYNTSGETDYRYLTTEYRLSKDGNLWSNWFALDESVSDFPPFDPKYNMFIEVKWIRRGDSNIGKVNLLSYELSGGYEGDLVVDDYSGEAQSIVTENTSGVFPQPLPNLEPEQITPIILGADSKIQGPAGPQGPIGLPGATGPQGPKGFPGNIGSQGPQGYNGIDGATGPQGRDGIDGATGPQGRDGIDGATGPQGRDGATGPGSVVAGSQGQLQYNDNGNLGASSNLYYDGSSVHIQGGGLSLDSGFSLMLNGIGDPLWRILRVAPYNNGILSNTELQALIPNTVEGFGVDNANGIPLFQVRGLGDLSYFNSPLKIGQYTLPNTDGTNNQVLTTDGSGTVSWKNIVGGTGDRYFATSSTYLTIPSVGTTLELITQPNLSYTVGQIVLISTTFSESFYGDVDYTSDFDLIPSFQGEIEYYDSVSGTMSVITTYSKRTGLTFSDWIISLGNVPNIPTNIGSFSFYDTTITTTWSGSDIVIESLNSDIILKGNSIYWGSIVGQMPNGGSYSYGSSVTSDDNFIYTIGGDDNIGYGLIVKTDINGNIIWKKEIVENSYGECIVVKNNTIFTLFTDNKNSGNILIVQLDTDSNILNQWSFTGPTTVYGFDMDTDESNNVYFVGYQSDTITLNSDLVIGKLNTSIDNIDWIYQAGVNKDDFNGSGIKYSNGFIYVTGYDNNGGILMKYDINGSLVWSNYTSSALEPRSITVDSSGNIYLCGSAGIVSTSFIMMLKPNGSLNWVHNINIGFNNLMATSIDIDNNGNLYILGINSTRFFGTSNFYYAKLLAYDGSIVFQKFLTISGYSESTIYDNGHRNIKYNNNTLYINGYLDTRGGDNMILISLPSDDLLTGSYVNPISGDTWIISDASYSLALNTSSIINGPSISSATLSSATSSFVLIDSLIDGYELTQFTYFQTIIEGNLNIGYNYVLPNIAGTVGQALIFPSSGNILEWQTITASGGGSQNLDEVLSIGNTSSTNIILSSGGFTNTLAVNYIQLISGVNSLSFNAGPTSTPFIGYNVNGNNLSIYSNPTSNNNIIVPDKSGIIALLSDITGGGGSQSLDQVLSVGNTSSQSINITDGHYTASISFNNILLEDNFGDSTYITSGDIVVYGGVYNLGLNGIGFFFQGTSSINYLTGPAYSGNYTWQLPSNSGMIALLSDLPAVGATGPRGATGANGLLATTNMYTIPYAPTFTYDNANGTLQQITLTGSATMNFSGISAGVFYFLEVTQDSIGSRTITWPTVTVAYGGGGIVPISTTPNSTDRYIIFYNGTKYRIDYALNYT